MEELKIQIKRVRPSDDPLRFTCLHDRGIGRNGSLRRLSIGELRLAPMERALIPTGIAIALPQGFEAQIRPRSGLALNQGLTLVNSPGTIDSDYRGEIQVIAINLGARADYHRARPAHRADGDPASCKSRVARG